MKGGLKFLSILMIIGAVISMIIYVIAVGLGGIAAVATEGDSLVLFWFIGTIISFIGAIVEFICGIKGIGTCANTAKAKNTFIWGIVNVVLVLIGNILQIVGGSAPEVYTWISSLAIPVIFAVLAYCLSVEA